MQGLQTVSDTDHVTNPIITTVTIIIKSLVFNHSS